MAVLAKNGVQLVVFLTEVNFSIYELFIQAPVLDFSV